MRRRRRSSFRKEKAIMLVSSALVLTALTATGLYVRSTEEKEEDGYVVDFTALEEESRGNGELADSGELDYDPSFQEAGSGEVENPGLNGQGADGQAAGADALTGEAQIAAGEGQIAAGSDPASGGDDLVEANASGRKAQEDGEQESSVQDGTGQEAGREGAAQDGTARENSAWEDDSARQEEDAMNSLPALDFTESDVLVWPIVGNVLVNYSMDKTVYFATLQQYKYNPAIIVSASLGEGITAAADGQVTTIYNDPEIGTAVVMNLGDGYELTYGQLTDLTVSEGDFVACGEIIGKVAEPTKYYSVEGCNVYFKLTHDGEPVNPLNRLS